MFPPNSSNKNVYRCMSYSVDPDTSLLRSIRNSSPKLKSSKIQTTRIASTVMLSDCEWNMILRMSLVYGRGCVLRFDVDADRLEAPLPFCCLV